MLPYHSSTASPADRDASSATRSRKSNRRAVALTTPPFYGPPPGPLGLHSQSRVRHVRHRLRHWTADVICGPFRRLAVPNQSVWRCAAPSASPTPRAPSSRGKCRLGSGSDPRTQGHVRAPRSAQHRRETRAVARHLLAASAPSPKAPLRVRRVQLEVGGSAHLRHGVDPPVAVNHWCAARPKPESAVKFSDYDHDSQCARLPHRHVPAQLAPQPCGCSPHDLLTHFPYSKPLLHALRSETQALQLF
mmetsp:Transcript_10587/g.19366  ORF Transcript_10587/g.19366 Transcript_10587/m.19366 type:complete len:247 (-) Transcript_10587:364-1104(-)